LICKQQGEAIVPSTARLLDEYLVVAAMAGDRAAFSQLAQRWHKRFVAHAWRLTGDQDTAREAVQSSWVEIIRGLSRLQDERAFPAWAYRIVSRASARQIGSRVRHRNLGAALIEEPDPEAPDPDARLMEARLRIIIHCLPPEQRAAVALFYFEEMSVAEVAVALDVPVGTVKTRLLHGRRKLRAAMEGDVT
jgi:RNA polymerase sigma-70 factor (ECF subfamily)